MADVIILNDKVIQDSQYELKLMDHLHQLTMNFKVSSDDYHEIATLLYKGEFEVKIPNEKVKFYGIIAEYSTSVTNLYKSGNVGDYRLVLKEKKE